jgi:hypothetical protein
MHMMAHEAAKEVDWDVIVAETGKQACARFAHLSDEERRSDSIPAS